MSVERIRVRAATKADVRGIHALVAIGTLRGHLLPRTAAEIRAHLGRWIVARQGRRVVGCLALEPTEPTLWEVRSVCVAEDYRHHGVGQRLMGTARRRARRAGVPRLFAVTAAVPFFHDAGFAHVPPGAREWSFVLRPIRPDYQVMVQDLGAVTAQPADAPLLATGAWSSHAEAHIGQLGSQRRLHHGLVALA